MEADGCLMVSILVSHEPRLVDALRQDGARVSYVIFLLLKLGAACYAKRTTRYMNEKQHAPLNCLFPNVESLWNWLTLSLCFWFAVCYSFNNI